MCLYEFDLVGLRKREDDNIRAVGKVAFHTELFSKKACL